MALPNLTRTRDELIAVHLSDEDIVEIIEALKIKAKAGQYEPCKILFELKYGKNPGPPSSGPSLADLLLERPLADGQMDSL
jgi:hypothetical protein